MTKLMTIWLACERSKIRPPGIDDFWGECDVKAQAELIAYNQVREDRNAQF